VTAEQLATENEIVRTVVGSTVHGLSIDGQDDQDEMGVCIEPPEYVVGLKVFEQHVYRTKPIGVRSGPGDVDRTIYSLRKYARLAASGNPTILLLLFSPFVIFSTPAGNRLRDIRPAFASKKAGHSFYGYMRAQRQRIIDERGGRHGKPRADFVERYGYDTKYAMHMLRLGYQGQEYLTSGTITLPMPEPTRGYLRNVRIGEVSLDHVLENAAELEHTLRDLLDSSPLPDEPDYDRINGFLIAEHEVHWSKVRDRYDRER